MQIIHISAPKPSRESIIDRVKDGAVFVYPTDTIYGIGCDATNSSAVQRVREIKKQNEQPLSVLAPGKEWIRANCRIPSSVEEWLAKIPGPYTLICTLKNQTAVAPEVTLGKSTLGVRLIAHQMQDIVAALGRPVVTTSANLHGKPFMTSLETLDPTVKKNADFILCEGPKEARPSTIVDLTTGKVIAR
jgi:L-threonylcarbamoyladenylate synthase